MWVTKYECVRKGGCKLECVLECSCLKREIRRMDVTVGMLFEFLFPNTFSTQKLSFIETKKKSTNI